MSDWSGKTVLITGACGTVGAELVRQTAARDVAAIVGVDNNESELFFLEEDWKHDERISVSLGDVRDPDSMRRLFDSVDIVLHSAGLKHVHLCEAAPRDAVQTNILGTQNVIDAALRCGVERLIFTSSDKAVNPTTVMGTSKLMGERLMTAAGLVESCSTVFASTRFGNVMGSRGSVIPLFKRQIAAGGPVTLTDRRMTRFIMSLHEAVQLVMESVFLARSGEVFVTKMPAIRIADLARVTIRAVAGDAPVEIIEVGPRPGEKMFEELINEEEVRRTVELEKYYVVVPPARMSNGDTEYPGLVASQIECPYTSESQSPMTEAEIARFLVDNELVAARADAPAGV